MRTLLIFLILVPTLSLGQTRARQKHYTEPPPPKITVEQNGGVTNYRVEGNLEPTHKLECIPIERAQNVFTPADLYLAVADCVSKENYVFAEKLFALAGIYGRFDSQRVTDKSATQAASVLIANTFASIPEERKMKFGEEFSRFVATPESLGMLCEEIRKVGMPDYYPRYMILHGMKAFLGNPNDEALLKNFDSQKVWADLQTTYLHCPM